MSGGVLSCHHNGSIRDIVGSIKGGILSNKLRVVQTLKPTTPRYRLHQLGTKDGTWDQLRGDDNRETRRKQEIKKS